MTESNAGGTQPSLPAAAPSWFQPSRQIWLALIGAVVVIAMIVLVVRYRSGSHKRNVDAQLLLTLDRLLTAQEGFYYDSSHYVGGLEQLPTVKLPPGVHVELHNPDRRSWWGVATHDGLSAHRCVVWVGTAPTYLPAELRAPENEAKPTCFDDARLASRQSTRS